MHVQRTVARHLRRIDPDALTHLDRVVLLVLAALGKAAMAGRVRQPHPVRELLRYLLERWHNLMRSPRGPDIPASAHRLEGWFGRFKPRVWLARGPKTEAGALNFVSLMAHAMA